MLVFASARTNHPRRLDPKAKARQTLGDLLKGTSVEEADWVRLVRSIARGDEQALRDLFERSHRLVFTLAFRISENREIAEEITLDVFHDVWVRSAKYEPEGGPVLGWIMNLARSRAIDRQRFEHRVKRQPRADIAGERVAEPVDATEAAQRRRSVHDALSVLTVDERRTIETAYFSELTYSETAARLDQPVGTVKTRIRAALAKLRDALRDEEGAS